MSKAPARTAAAPLATRHVFLYTQVYRKLRHNPGNPALRFLARHVADQHVSLHVTEVTLAEVRRQITDDVEVARRDSAKVEQDLARWRHSAHVDPTPFLPAGFADTDAIRAALVTHGTHGKDGMLATVLEARNLF